MKPLQVTSNHHAGITRLVAGAASVLAVAAGAPSLYLALLTVLAPASARPLPRQRAGSTKFAIFIPAHDEAGVISETVHALVGQHYPTSKFEVHVVADNCSDGTAEVAAVAGAIVHERVDLEDLGKGAALNWLANELSDRPFDVLVVVDADTVADSDFLAALDRAFSSGAPVVQGYYGVKEPDNSTAVGLRSAAIACRHHLRPLARNRLGASCGLYGNGMAFRVDVVAGRKWSNHLIEDAEFQIELLLDGYTVTYVPDAVVRAEMPASLDGATSQNERWELGRLQLARRYVPPLLRRTLIGGSLSRRVYVDAVADLVSPPLSMQTLLDAAAVSLAATSVLIQPNRRSRLLFATGLASSAVLVAHVLVALRLVRAPAGVYRSLRSAPRAVVWKLLLLARVARRPDAVTWTRTARNIDDASNS